MAMSIKKIKEAIQNNVGMPCSIISKQGRKVKQYKECFIESAYPEIFCVEYVNPQKEKKEKLTFSYTDLFIKKVFVCKRTFDSNKKMA